ncbi:TraE/TraK family type IV conjugative transfer system protein [Caminibacter sp.]
MSEKNKKEYKKSQEVEKELKKPIYKIIGKEYVDRVYAVLTENRYLTFMSFIFIIIIIYLLVSISKLEEKIKISVEIPPKIYQTGQIYIGYEKANSLFYKLWGEYVAREIGNYSPVDIDEKIKKVLYLFAPERIIKAQADFNSFADNIKNNLITNTFTPYKVRGNNKGEVVVEGLSHKKVGANLLNETYLCLYKMKFKIVDYHLFLEKFITDCKKINKEVEKAYLEEIKKEERKKKIQKAKK